MTNSNEHAFSCNGAGMAWLLALAAICSTATAEEIASFTYQGRIAHLIKHTGNRATAVSECNNQYPGSTLGTFYDADEWALYKEKSPAAPGGKDSWIAGKLYKGFVKQDMNDPHQEYYAVEEGTEGAVDLCKTDVCYIWDFGPRTGYVISLGGKNTNPFRGYLGAKWHSNEPSDQEFILIRNAGINDAKSSTQPQYIWCMLYPEETTVETTIETTSTTSISSITGEATTGGSGSANGTAGKTSEAASSANKGDDSSSTTIIIVVVVVVVVVIAIIAVVVYFVVIRSSGKPAVTVEEGGDSDTPMLPVNDAEANEMQEGTVPTQEDAEGEK